jgi:hypothetical protein
VARKDRERARRRHAIERAQRASGAEPSTPTPKAKPKPAEPARNSRNRPRLAARTPVRGAAKQRPQSEQYKVKGKVGDLTTTGMFGRRQVTRTRDMLVHPKITVRVIMAAFVLALAGFALPRFGLVHGNLDALTFAAFAISFFGLADLAPTWRQTVPLALFGVLSVVVATAPLLA